MNPMKETYQGLLSTYQGIQNKQARQDLKESRFKYDTLHSEEARKQAAERRTLQDHNLKLAERQYAAAIAAYQAGDEQGAMSLMQQADDLSGGLFTGMATGVNSRMATLSEEVATGKRSARDPEFIAAVQGYTRPTMRNSGRDKDYTLDGLEALPNGKVGYTMSPKSIGAIQNRIIQVESNGQANAKNPRSSATGVGQFIDSTWIAMMRKYEPRLTQGKSTAQLLEMRTDPDLSKAMVRRYAEENAAVLEQNDIPVTAQSVYAAHHFGPQMAVTMFKADPRTPMVNIVGERAIQANPHLKGKSVGQVLGWVQRKMQVPATHGLSSEPDDPVVAYSREELMGHVREGVEREQQFNQSIPPKLKEMLAARGAGMGISTAKPAAKEQAKQWSKLDDGTLYNEYTGETKAVKGGNSRLNDDMALFNDNKNSYILAQAQQIGINDNDAQLEFLNEINKKAGAKADFNTTYQAIVDHHKKVVAKELADTLLQGVDQNMIDEGDKIASTFQVLHQQAKALGLKAGEAKELAQDAIDEVGKSDSAKLANYIGQRLKVLQQQKAEDERYKANLKMNDPDRYDFQFGTGLPVSP